MLNVATVELAPIAVGETTTLGEKLITGDGYTPAPSVEMAAVSLAIFAPLVANAGLDPKVLRHVVLGPTGTPEVYVTKNGLNGDLSDEGIDSLEYVRIR